MNSGNTREDFDASEFMFEEQSKTEEERKPSRKKKRGSQSRKRTRSPSADLVGLSSQASQAASRRPASSQIVEASPPPPRAPKDVLELLRSEVKEKYGQSLARGLPAFLTRKESGEIKKIILALYTPDVVIDMVRVLVWDWELILDNTKVWRQPIPTINNLIHFRNLLASSVGTGIPCTGGIYRGRELSYVNRYLAKPSDSTNSDEEQPF